MKKKILFFIHDLCGGGAEKVLVNLVNHLDPNKFDVYVVSMFGGGVNRKNLAPHINYRFIFSKTFRGNSKIIKYFSSSLLHRWFIKDHYDIEVACLEGGISKIISGCNDSNTRLVSWIHTEQRNYKGAIGYFRNENEAHSCYSKFDKIVCVSETVKQRFIKNFPTAKEPIVLYNVLETEKIKELSKDIVNDNNFNNDEINIVTVGKIDKSKGIDRLARIILRLRKDGFPVHFFAIGTGSDRKEIEQFLENNSLSEWFTFLGYKTNPYKYVAKCDLYACASLQEGFSTATTEALIVGTPVCTVKVSGMREMLGDNQWGLITNNDEESLYMGLKELIANPRLLDKYKLKAKERGEFFSTERTVCAYEKMLMNL